MKFLIRLAINALALYAAIRIVPGIHGQNTSIWALLGLALIFGVVNALLRPLLKLLTCPLIIVTLGLFTLILNTFMFYLTGVIGKAFNVGFEVDGILSAFLGSIVVSLVSIVLSLFFKDELKKKHRD